MTYETYGQIVQDNEHKESESVTIKSVLFISPKEQGNDIPLVKAESMTQIKFLPGLALERPAVEP